MSRVFGVSASQARIAGLVTRQLSNLPSLEKMVKSEHVTGALIPNRRQRRFEDKQKRKQQ